MVRKLFCKKSVLSAESVLKVAGMVLDNLLALKSRTVSRVRKPTEPGMDPVRAFCPRIKDCRDLRLPTVLGIVPVKAFLSA